MSLTATQRGHLARNSGLTRAVIGFTNQYAANPGNHTWSNAGLCLHFADPDKEQIPGMNANGCSHAEFMAALLQAVTDLQP